MTPLMPCLGHEVQCALARADHGLPALHREVAGPGHQRYLLQFVSSIWDLGWDVVVLAVVGEGALVKGLHHHLHLLLEQLPVGVLVNDGVAEALDFTRVVTPANAEDDPSLRSGCRRSRSPPPDAAGATWG